MDCPSQTIVKNGKDYHQDGKAIQNYLCKGCGKRFNEGTGTPANVVSLALKMKREGMGIRASGRVLEKSHGSIMRWEQKLATQPQPAQSRYTSGGR